MVRVELRLVLSTPHLQAVALNQVQDTMSAKIGTSAPGRHDMTFSPRSQDLFLPRVAELATFSSEIWRQWCSICGYRKEP